MTRLLLLCLIVISAGCSAAEDTCPLCDASPCERTGCAASDDAPPTDTPTDGGAGMATAAPVCGDGTCHDDETCDNCPADCGACPWPSDWVAKEQRILELVNEARASGVNCPSGPQPATHPVAYHEALTWAARRHSEDMGTQNYFSHTSQDGRSFADRVYEAGYDAFAYGENIAAGNVDAEDTFNQWLLSDGHCRNMMSGQANELGVGYAQVEGSMYGHYWTQNFGRR